MTRIPGVSGYAPVIDPDLLAKFMYDYDMPEMPDTGGTIADLLAKTGGGNPWIAGGFAGMGVLGRLFGENRQLEFQKKKYRNRMKYAEELKAEPEGDYLGEGEILRNVSLGKQAITPEMNRIAFNMARFAGVESPQAHAMMASKILPLLAANELDWRELSTKLGFQRTQAKKSRIASLLR